MSAGFFNSLTPSTNSLTPLETLSKEVDRNRTDLNRTTTQMDILTKTTVSGKKNMEEGWRPGSTSIQTLDQVHTPESCRMLAIAMNEHNGNDDIAGFLYRNDKHPSLPETCVLYSKVTANGTLRDKPEHLTGCVNPTKKINSGCTMTNKCALDYCNTHTDLKNAFCGGNKCKSISQADKCMTHWINNGKSEGRNGVDNWCKHTK